MVMGPESPKTSIPLRSDSINGYGTASNRSIATAARFRDSNYHMFLAKYNIYIECIEPAKELMQRTIEIISPPRAFSKVDDATVKDLVGSPRMLRSKNQATIMSELGNRIAPNLFRLHKRLAKSVKWPWSNHVPLPLRPGILFNLLHLPDPKPNFAFGHSNLAFTSKQQRMVDHLTDDKFEKSYSMPDDELIFPFLHIKFMSQADGDTNYVATNQAAGAGAIAINGYLELMRRSSR